MNGHTASINSSTASTSRRTACFNGRTASLNGDRPVISDPESAGWVAVSCTEAEASAVEQRDVSFMVELGLLHPEIKYTTTHSWYKWCGDDGVLLYLVSQCERARRLGEGGWRRVSLNRGLDREVAERKTRKSVGLKREGECGPERECVVWKERVCGLKRECVYVVWKESLWFEKSVCVRGLEREFMRFGKRGCDLRRERVCVVWKESVWFGKRECVVSTESQKSSEVGSHAMCTGRRSP
eukprot:1212461-Rhodomonas_salina.1